MKVNSWKEIGAETRQRIGKSSITHDSRLYDVRNFHISLKQWRMLHAVVDCDGFTGAANQLHLSQSAISYTVAKLQEQLGLPLLKVEGRKAQVTEAGKILLERSRNLIHEALELEALAENLKNGWTAEVCLAADQNYPTRLLMLALRKFSQLTQNIKVTLHELNAQQSEKALRERSADLAISAHVPSGLIGNPLMEVEHVAVAQCMHPLFSLQRSITAADLERQVQIVISSQKDMMQHADKHHIVGYHRPWNVSSFDAAISALRECMGYAWLPRHRLQEWLDQGELRILPLMEGSAYTTSLYLIHSRPFRPDSVAKRLADVLHSLSAAPPTEHDKCCSSL